MTDKVEILSWSTQPFEQDSELIGAGAAHIFAEIDQIDTNFILRLWDTAPNGQRQLITTGYLKASHHELDERTTEGNPYHPHTRSVPVEPGRSRSTYCASTRSPTRSRQVIASRLNCPTMSRWPTSTTHYSRLTPSTCR
ncbi:hypothetical protein AHiyo8_06430 [Arthrobacter sp. Hiyo8]|nr:hypothetical protein AHiyo8_06430 [Arthrobacter sp. Hiyo8]